LGARRDDPRKAALPIMAALGGMIAPAGIRQFHADVLPENSGMLKIFCRSGLNTETVTDEGVVRVSIRLQD